MSASLVGSEMCIRDSAQGGCAMRTGPVCVASVCMSARCACDASCKHDAVSYTHLTLPTICSV
eukprot:13208429-Alexandrium_andersonii.AAC.1